MSASREGLLEVQHEASYVKDVFMWIDSVSHQETTRAVLVYIGLVIATLITGLRGGSSIIHHSSDRSFAPGTAPQVFHFDAAPVSSFNRFLNFELSFTGTPSTTVPLTFSYKVVPSPPDTIVPPVARSFTNHPVETGSSGRTGKLSLFADRMINYTGVDLVVTATPASGITGLTAYTTLGGRDNTKFQAYFRFAFSFFEGLILNFVIPHLGFVDWIRWSLAQKLTIPLLFAVILSNNPLYLIHAYFPYTFFTNLDLIMTPIFHGLLYFAVLTLLDSLTGRSDTLTLARSTPAIIAGGAKLVSEFLVQRKVYAVVATRQPSLTGGRVAWLLGAVATGADAAFAVAAAFCVLRALTLAPSSEAGKIQAYLVPLGALAANVAFWVLFGGVFGLAKGTELEPLMKFVLENMAVLALGILHWPLETIVELAYDVNGEDG
jgi:hypothetical protein